MRHMGDITKLNGHDLPIVDIITGGSPCQDLSVAGKRAGLAGERSGLFMEQIRIIKEMRDECVRQLRSNGADVNIRHIKPRYMVWENVPGAFSSNKGEDFRAVLEETAKVADENAVVPGLEGGRWTPSGCIVGNRWSIAWRVHDAQFWGVPQRRKRIALVADFGGHTAPEILFERKSLFGDIAESGEERENASETVREDIDPPIYDVRISSDGTKNWRAHAYEAEVCRNLDTGGVTQTATTEDLPSSKVYGISAYESNSMKSSNPNSGIYEADTTRTLDNNGGNPACNQGGMIVLEGNGSRPSHRGNGYQEGDTMYTLNTTEHHAVCVSQDAYDKYSENDKSASIKASGGVYGGGSVQLETERLQGCNGFGDTVGALCAGDAKHIGNQYVSQGKCIIQHKG